MIIKSAVEEIKKCVNEALSTLQSPPESAKKDPDVDNDRMDLDTKTENYDEQTLSESGWRGPVSSVMQLMDLGYWPAAPSVNGETYFDMSNCDLEVTGAGEGFGYEQCNFHTGYPGQIPAYYNDPWGSWSMGS